MNNRSLISGDDHRAVRRLLENSPKKENASRIAVLLSKSVVNNKLNVNTIITSTGSIGRVERRAALQINVRERAHFLEDVILNEQRTTEQERRAIHEGKLRPWRISSRRVFSARKYAELKRIRHTRTGKQQSVDDDEEDIGQFDHRRTFAFIADRLDSLRYRVQPRTTAGRRTRRSTANVFPTLAFATASDQVRRTSRSTDEDKLVSPISGVKFGFWSKRKVSIGP